MLTADYNPSRIDHRDAKRHWNDLRRVFSRSPDVQSLKPNAWLTFIVSETVWGFFYFEDRLSSSAGKFFSPVRICHSSVKMANRSSAEMVSNVLVSSSAWMSLWDKFRIRSSMRREGVTPRTLLRPSDRDKCNCCGTTWPKNAEGLALGTEGDGVQQKRERSLMPTNIK